MCSRDTLRDTVLLLAGVGAMVITLGTGLAWLMTAYDFPGRRIFDWALLLPLAIPTYIMAFAYLDMLHPIGPVQSGLRALLGITNPRDLWFPEVRSLGGCILLFGLRALPLRLPFHARDVPDAGREPDRSLAHAGRHRARACSSRWRCRSRGRRSRSARRSR